MSIRPAYRTTSRATDRMNTVIILGGSGLLGQALMRECARRGRHAVDLSRSMGVDLTRLHSPHALGQVLRPHTPDLVINAAAITELALCERDALQASALHARLPGLLAAWARDSGVPWVQVSTDHYYASPSNVLHDEDAPVILLNEYARTKHAGETLALASPQALVLRTNIVGCRGWPGQPSFAEWAIQALLSGQPFEGYTDAWASSMEAGQCAGALLDLADRGARGLLNVAARQSSSKAQFIGALAQALGLDATGLRPQPRPKFGLPRANALGLDVRRAEVILGYPLPNSDEVANALAVVFKEQIRVAA